MQFDALPAPYMPTPAPRMRNRRVFDSTAGPCLYCCLFHSIDRPGFPSAIPHPLVIYFLLQQFCCPNKELIVKVGVFAVLFSAMKFEDALDYVRSVGVEAVEIGCGGYVGDAHCKPAQLLGDADAIAALKAAVERRGLAISALSAHANPLHPNPEIGEAHRTYVTNAILMAEAMGVDTVVTFSGCPGGGPGDLTPNWVTCPWPNDFSVTLKYQWDEVMLPYWEKTAAFAAERGVRLAIEMHPGFCVYNPGTLLRLREAIGPTIGANFDPSHLFWQGVNLTSAIRTLGDALQRLC